MRNSIFEYVNTCVECQKTNLPRQARLGLLKPLPAEHYPWINVSANLIGPLPKSEGIDAILVVVDRVMKMSVFIPTNTTMDAAEFANLYF